MRINCEASRRLTRSAIEADKVIRRGLNRIARGRLNPDRYQVGAVRLQEQIRELDRTIQAVLILFVPSEAQAAASGRAPSPPKAP